MYPTCYKCKKKIDAKGYCLFVDLGDLPTPVHKKYWEKKDGHTR